MRWVVRIKLFAVCAGLLLLGCLAAWVRTGHRYNQHPMHQLVSTSAHAIAPMGISTVRCTAAVAASAAASGHTLGW
jgi:hypothetical protein